MHLSTSLGVHVSFNPGSISSRALPSFHNFHAYKKPNIVIDSSIELEFKFDALVVKEAYISYEIKRRICIIRAIILFSTKNL